MRSEVEFKAELMRRVKAHRVRQQQRRKAIAMAAMTAACVVIVAVTVGPDLTDSDNWAVYGSTRPQTDVSTMSGHPDRETVSEQTVETQPTDGVQGEMVDQLPENAGPETETGITKIQIQSDGLTVDYTEQGTIECLLDLLEEVQMTPPQNTASSVVTGEVFNGSLSETEGSGDSVQGQIKPPAADGLDSRIGRILVQSENGDLLIYIAEIGDIQKGSDQVNIRYIYLSAEQWKTIKQELVKLSAEQGE